MQALQISDLNINPLITQPLCPLQIFFSSKKSIAIDGFRTPNIKLFFYYGEQLGRIENTSLIICSQGKLYIYFFHGQRKGVISGKPLPRPRAYGRHWDRITICTKDQKFVIVENNLQTELGLLTLPPALKKAVISILTWPRRVFLCRPKKASGRGCVPAVTRAKFILPVRPGKGGKKNSQHPPSRLDQSSRLLKTVSRRRIAN